MSDNFKFTKTAIEWRRNIVLQKLSQGYNQSQIAEELQLHPSTISLDCQYLREKSQQALRKHVSETVPMEYSLAMSGLRRVLWMANQLLDKEKPDIKSKISILQLLATIHKDMLSLTADGVIVERALAKINAMEAALLPAEQEESSDVTTEQEQTESDEEAGEEPTNEKE